MPPDEPHDDREVFHQSMTQAQNSHGLGSSSPTDVKAKGIDATSLLQNATSIQSMLKNTTETGGVGHFSQSQRQVSSNRSGRPPKIAPRPRVGSRNFSPTLPRRHQESRFGSGRSMPTAPRYALSSPPTGQDPHSPSPLSYQETTRTTSVEEYRAFTATQGSYIAHNPENRHPYLQNGRHQNRGQMQGVRPRSPFAYPTRLKRPGYRPSSPALSLTRSFHGSDVDRVNGSRTASPASMYTLNRIPTPRQQVVNRSDPTLRYYPSIHGLPSSRGSTPKPAPSVGSVASSVRLSQVAVHYPGAWPDSPAITPPPLFYDYSEAFEEQTEQAAQTRVHRISVSIVTSPVSHVNNDQGQYWERPQNTESEFLVELPSGSTSTPIVELNVFRSDNSRPHSVNDRQHEEADFNQVQQMKPMEMLNSSPPDGPSAILRSTSTKTEDQIIENHALPVKLDEPPPGDARQQASPAVESQQPREPGITETPKTAIEPPVSEQDQSSPLASLYSERSSVHGEILEDSTEPTSRADTGDASPVGPPRTPLNKPISVEYLDCPPQSQNSKASKTSTSVESVGIKYPEVVAPTPERSIISLSNRERFSKILGLDEGLHESDGLASSSRVQKDLPSYSKDSVLKDYEMMQRCLSLSPAEVDHDIHLTSSLLEAFGRSNGDDYDDTSRKSSSVSSRPVHDSSRSFESPKWGTPTPSTVRLSHRRMVINAGQAIEAKNDDVSKPPTIAEDEVHESNHEVSSKEANETRRSYIEKALSQSVFPSMSIKAFVPPKGAYQSALPFAFTPLVQPCSEDESSVDLEVTTSGLLKVHESQKETVKETPPIADTAIERASTASPPASRPWNLDTSYPWDGDEPPKLDVVMPLRDRDLLQSGDRLPKFKLRIHRASSSAASKLTKKNRSSEDTMSSVFASSVDLLKSASFRRAQKPRPSAGPGDCNSSHDVIRTSPMQTRFIESFERPVLTSPVTSLMPVSPALDVRSFFSDDSSQDRPKGSLRKRLSEFRTRNSRANSVDHGPSYERGHPSFASGPSKPNGRGSGPSQTPTVASSRHSSIRRLRWAIFGRLRSWMSRRDGGIRLWRRKRSTDAQADNQPLYAGV